jgi:hypothetical protein
VDVVRPPTHHCPPVFSAVPGALCQPGGSVLVCLPGLSGEVTLDALWSRLPKGESRNHPVRTWSDLKSCDSRCLKIADGERNLIVSEACALERRQLTWTEEMTSVVTLDQMQVTINGNAAASMMVLVS